MNHKRYTSLLFDLDDTLLEYSDIELSSALTVLENHSLPYGADVLELFDETFGFNIFELGKDITLFDVVTNRFVRFLKLLEIKGELFEELKTEFFDMMQNSHKLKPGALKTLRYLKNSGYLLYIITNGYPEFQYKRIKQAKIMNFFTEIFVSEEINYKKPSASFYDYVMNNILENNRSKVLIIGDAPTADILGGINSKIDTCLVAEEDKLCKYSYNYRIKKIDELINLL